MSNHKVELLSPSSFAFAMATATLSRAADVTKWELLSPIFFWLANFAFAALIVLYILRIVMFFTRVVDDFSSYTKAPGYLTIVAATCLIGTLWADERAMYEVANVMWIAGLSLWIVLFFAMIILHILNENKPVAASAVNGSWFLLVVSTESISILASTLSDHFDTDRTGLVLTAELFIFLGAFIYILLAAAVFYRLLFVPLKPKDVAPPLWITMGAAAIISVSCGQLIERVDASNLSTHAGLLTGMLLCFWVVAAFWIPILTAMDWWRYVEHKSTLKYEPEWWSMVFPLGMFSVCSSRVGDTLHVNVITDIAEVFFPVTVIFWLVLFVAMARRMIGTT